jgi:hypothetical protein
MRESGGKYDPSLLNYFAECLSVWLPKELDDVGMQGEICEWANGYNEYRKDILKNLFLHGDE